jgi:hypothetical protein
MFSHNSLALSHSCNQTIKRKNPTHDLKNQTRRTFSLLKPKVVGSGEREREAHIFKNLRERERFGSVFYIIHKKYIF